MLQTMNVWTTNTTDLLANLNSLLEGNDTGATLMVVDMLANELNDPGADVSWWVPEWYKSHLCFKYARGRGGDERRGREHKSTR